MGIFGNRKQARSGAPRKIAVAVIHGIGSQAESRPANSTMLSFSKDLHKRIRKELGPKSFDTQIVWREIFWSDVLAPRQMRYLEAIRDKVNFRSLREFLLFNIADAASYKKTDPDAQSAYNMIHGRIRDVLRELREDTDDDTPLIIMAHSFGSQIMSNYIWDMQQATTKAPTPFERMETLGGFLTFGSNIPLFLFSYAPENIQPISYPGVKLPDEMQQHYPWWLNFYDKDDIVAFPLRETGPAYEAMVDSGQIDEIMIDVGNIFTSWTPKSHTAYWRDKNFFRPAAKFIQQFLNR